MNKKEIEIISKLKDFDLVTFENNKGLWTVSRATEKAILIDGEWLPKSQIVGLSMVEKKKWHGDNINFTMVTVPELVINKWFEDMCAKKRGRSTYAY